MPVAASRKAAVAERIPPHAFFLISAIFHYLGPSFAALLFVYVPPLGVAWLRIATAALVFAAWRRPWRAVASAGPRTRLLILSLGAALAAMNACFYLAIARLPLATVAAIEFVATIALALAGVRTPRNLGALIATLAGVYALIGFEPTLDSIGLSFAAANALLFAVYIVLGHALARQGEGAVDRLAAAMVAALVLAAPIGLADAAVAFTDPALLLAGLGVGVTSSVIPYVCDQFAMARLPRATFALMLALLPATAALVGALVLRQVPSAIEVLGILLVVLGVAIHRPAR